MSLCLRECIVRVLVSFQGLLYHLQAEATLLLDILQLLRLRFLLQEPLDLVMDSCAKLGEGVWGVVGRRWYIPVCFVGDGGGHIFVACWLAGWLAGVDVAAGAV